MNDDKRDKKHKYLQRPMTTKWSVLLDRTHAYVIVSTF